MQSLLQVILLGIDRKIVQANEKISFWFHAEWSNCRINYFEITS